MIIFENIKWKNFLSTGNQFIEIVLNKYNSTLLIGENAAGKSTILDAICFVLFGKAFRNINKPQLINSINQKNCLVEIEFSIGKRKYKIIRGMKPGIFEIYQDNNLLSQEAANKDYQNYLEHKILKLNFKSFTQIVILGSASFTPFMQLAQGTRREVIEDILDIQIFSVMNNVLKIRIQNNKEASKDIINLLEIGKQKTKLQHQYLLQLEEDTKKRKENIKIQIDETNLEIEQSQLYINQYTKQYNDLNHQVKNDVQLQNKKTEFITLYKTLQNKITTIDKEMEFYGNNDFCPTCAQEITNDLKITTIHKHTNKKDEIEKALKKLYKQIQKLEIQYNEISEQKRKLISIQQNITEENSKIIAQQNYIKKLNKESSEIVESQENIESVKETLRLMAKEVIKNTEEKSKLNEEAFYLDAAATLLKDTGIKTKIIKQYLPVINKLVNKYLSVMDFFVSFELDEAFNEVIKSRHRDEFSYSSFSEGEKQRIDLALLFTWRTIAKMKNSVSTNLLLLDEVFDSSLDNNGTECVMSLLNTLGDDANVFVISHKGDQLQDKFSHVIKFAKHQNFSRIF
jgi:DNA repair exonuclease SbcCD ATPase subunit